MVASKSAALFCHSEPGLELPGGNLDELEDDGGDDDDDDDDDDEVKSW